MYTTSEIYALGMDCLIEKLGVEHAEHFISVVKRESGDYTKWRRQVFDDMTLDQVFDEAEAYARNHPHKG